MSRGLVAGWVSYAIGIVIWIIIIDAVLSLIMATGSRSSFFYSLYKITSGITQPIYRPLRRIIPPVRMGDAALDLSPLIVILGLQILRIILTGIILGS